MTEPEFVQDPDEEILPPAPPRPRDPRWFRGAMAATLLLLLPVAVGTLAHAQSRKEADRAGRAALARAHRARLAQEAKLASDGLEAAIVLYSTEPTTDRYQAVEAAAEHFELGTTEIAAVAARAGDAPAARWLRDRRGDLQAQHGQILELADQRQIALRDLGARAEDVCRQVESRLQPAPGVADHVALGRTDASLRIQMDVRAAVAAVRAYALTRDPTTSNRLREAATSFDVHVRAYRGTDPSTEELSRLDFVSEDFEFLLATAEQVIKRTDELQGGLQDLAAKHDEFVGRLERDAPVARPGDAPADAPQIPLSGAITAAALTFLGALLALTAARALRRAAVPATVGAPLESDPAGPPDSSTPSGRGGPGELEDLGVAFNRMVEILARSEGMVREKEVRLRMILETAAEGIITIDQRGHIESFNATAKTIFGYREVEVLGRNVSILMPEPHRSRHDHYLERYLRTGDRRIIGQSIQVEGRRKDGELFPMELVVSEANLGKRGRIFTGIVRDVTERQRAEQEQARLIKELEARNAEMERFTYTVSHDLKSPLITIKGFLGLLEKDLETRNDKRIRTDMDHISQAAESMHALLTELLDLSRVGRILGPQQDVEMRELVDEAVQLLGGAIAERGTVVEVLPDMPTISGDRRRLVEVFQNLIENAVKFMGDQAEPRIEIGMRPAGADGMPVCYVRDNGVGIEARYHEKVFGLFERLDQEHEGTGIGLALVKRIVQLHGGRIWVESEGLGKGCTFCVAIPRKKEEAVHVAV